MPLQRISEIQKRLKAPLEKAVKVRGIGECWWGREIKYTYVTAGLGYHDVLSELHHTWLGRKCTAFGLWGS